MEIILDPLDPFYKKNLICCWLRGLGSVLGQNPYFLYDYRGMAWLPPVAPARLGNTGELDATFELLNPLDDIAKVQATLS